VFSALAALMLWGIFSSTVALLFMLAVLLIVMAQSRAATL